MYKEIVRKREDGHGVAKGLLGLVTFYLRLVVSFWYCKFKKKNTRFRKQHKTIWRIRLTFGGLQGSKRAPFPILHHDVIFLQVLVHIEVIQTYYFLLHIKWRFHSKGVKPRNAIVDGSLYSG